MPQTSYYRRLNSKADSDFYPTPEWAILSLLEVEKFKGVITECACGDGAISKTLKREGYTVKSSDLVYRGYGKGGVDFLKSRKTMQNVITNPPYNLANQFVLHALNYTERKVAMFLRLSFLEGIQRRNSIFENHPPTRIWVFSERVTLYKNGLSNSKATGTVAYGWFVWNNRVTVSDTVVRWLPMGFKQKSKGT